MEAEIQWSTSGGNDRMEEFLGVVQFRRLEEGLLLVGSRRDWKFGFLSKFG